MLARYGAVIHADQRVGAGFDTTAKDSPDGRQPATRVKSGPRLGLSVALTLAALAWGFVNFGVMLWLPASLITEGRSVGLTSALIARSALIAVPTVAVATYLYSLWSTKRVLLLAIGITTLGPSFGDPFFGITEHCHSFGKPADLRLPFDRRNQCGDFDPNALCGREFSR